MAERVEQRSVSVRIDGKEIESTLKSISREMGRLKDETARAAEGTDAYVNRALSLAQADEAAKKNRASIKAIADIWERMPEDVKASVLEQQKDLQKLRQTYIDLVKAGQKVDSINMKMLAKDIEKAEARIASTVTAFSNLDKTATNNIEHVKKRFSELNKELDKATINSQEYYEKIKEYKNLEKVLEDHKKSITGITKAWHEQIPGINGVIAAAAGMFAVDQIVAYGRELYKTGVELDNIARKSTVVLKEQLSFVSEEARKNATDIGLAREQYVGLSTDVTAFLQSQKFSREEAAKMSTEVVNLSGVLSQFSGGGVEKTHEALEAIKGAFAEDVEQLAKFNIAISENVVQAKMMELGLDKMNAAAQQHGRAMIILKMITDGAAAQNEAFTGSADGMVRSQARIDAMLANITNNLAKFFIPLFEKLLNVVAPVADWLGEVSGAMAGMVNPSKAASDAFFEQKNKVGELEKSLPKLLEKYEHLTEKSKKVGGETKLNKKEQEELKKAIQGIGEIVPTSIIEIDRYGKALKINASAAEEFLVAQRKILKLDNADAITKTSSRLDYLEGEEVRIREQIEKINKGIIVGTSGFFGKNYLKDTDAKIEAVTELQNKLGKVTQEWDTLYYKRQQLRGEPLDDIKAPDTPDMSGVSIYDQNEAKKREAEIQKDLEKLREARERHEADVTRNLLDNEAARAEAIRAKYREDIQLAETLEKQKGKIGEEAYQLKLALEKQRGIEIRDIYTDVLKKQLDDIEKFLDDGNLKRLTANEKEIQGIYSKYDKQIAVAQRIENDLLNTTEAQRATAHTQKLALMATREREIEAFQETKRLEKDFKAAEQTIKDLEATKKFFEEVKRIEDEYNQYVADTNAGLKPVKSVEGSFEELELFKIQIQSKADAEIEQERLKLEKLLAANQGYEERLDAIRKAFDVKKKNIQDVADADKTKKEQEFVNKTIQNYNALANAVGNAFTALGDIIGAETEEAAALQKVAALAKIVFDTAQAISGVVAAAASTSITPIDLAIKVASGVAVVLANIAMAKEVLSTAPKVKAKADGGTIGVVGNQDGQYYDAFMGGEAKTGMVTRPNVFLAGEKGEEYVIANPELKIPEVANFLPVIEAHRQRRKSGTTRQFEDGGNVGSASNNQNIPSGAPVSPSNTEGVFIAVAEKMMAVLEKMESAFDKGVVFTWEDLVEFGKRQNTLNHIKK